MKEYQKPEVELIDFEAENITVDQDTTSIQGNNPYDDE